MLSDDFWSVELGHGMGPLVLGLPRNQVIACLSDHGLEGFLDDDEDDPEVYVDDIETMLVFSNESSRGLKRIDVDDSRLRFGPMQVHGKRIHEIVQLLNVPSSETLWCDFFEDDEQVAYQTKAPKAKSDRELLTYSTLWITTLGLGLSLYRGEIVTVHLCDPAHAPQIGNGSWTAEQHLLSEAGIAPADSVTAAGKQTFTRVLLLAVTIAMGALVWKAIVLQQKWNQAPEVTARVVDANPPPPAPFPEAYTLGYVDQNGGEHQVVFRSADIYGLPAIGEEINIRYLPEAPDKPLSHARYRDVGFDFAMPYGIAIFGSYWVINLLVSVLSLIRFKPTIGKL